MDCDTCEGTGYIETETVLVGRPRYDKELRQVVYDCWGKGDWKPTICPDCCDMDEE